MARVTYVWFVRDATKDSELGDVVGKLYLDTDRHEDGVSIFHYFVGTGESDFKKENHRFYSTQAAAVAVAKKQLVARNVAFGYPTGYGIY
jgi:hypothetical protein